MSLVDVDRLLVPRLVVEETDRGLRHAASSGNECFVLWSGVLLGRTFDVRACHVPRQTRYRLASGLLVRIDGPELHRLNRWLFDNGQMLGVQVHSHPGAAYHSETDDTFPIVTTLGGLSIVVPFFCRDGVLGAGVVTYRLERSGWIEVPYATSRQLLEFSS